MFDHCMYFNLSALNRKISKIWQDKFQSLGFSPSHGYLLVAMAANPTATQKELSQIMELDASTVTRFIDLLAAKKMIRKTSIGKGATFALTKQGREASQQIEQLMDELLVSMQKVFGKRKFTHFVDQVHSARQCLEERTG